NLIVPGIGFLKGLAEWNQFWGLKDPGSMLGKVRMRGNVMQMLTNAPGNITPDNFRLRADSAGYRAGKDGRDLGADVDLVVPGPAYERSKKTPEYRQWLKDTGQLSREKSRRDAKPFIVLASQGGGERTFETLGGAVKSASDGDTIEIRGNGPFFTDPL